MAVTVAEFDGQRGVGDQHGEGSSGVGAADADALTADRHDAGVVGEALHPDRFECWPGRRPGRAGAAEPQRLFGGERVRPGAEQGSGVV